ncbi:DNA-directed RNA polymerase subunit alpha [Candidatus Uhrbacteria bacterium]|nr:DNA-directed RNA polymerase subunit alpha [Candidatus Uhrbacteria bacterium]
MESILLPSKIRFSKGERPHEGVLTVEPCTQGYGTTLGNALRRVLLSSLPGAAVTAVKIKGVDHEFSTIPHVKEDALEIILNLKTLRLKLHAEEPVKLTLSVKGEKAVTAKDFSKNADVEIVNGDLVLATLTDKAASLEMEITVGPGRGYKSTEERAKEKLELGTIAIDALYSPVLNVSYKVMATRVGERTDYDKLVLHIETDGTVDPLDACTQAVAILLDHFQLLNNLTYEASE